MCDMKLGMTLIVAVIFSCLPLGWVQAADLLYVRSGEHKVFTRIVFQFKDVVQSKAPIITGKGKFYVVFPNSTTVLPRQVLNKKTRGVQSVELVQGKSQLTANITLSFPFFRLTTFFLPNPNRFVIDAYRIVSPANKIEPKQTLQVSPPVSVPPAPAEKKETTPAKEFSTKKVGDVPKKEIPNNPLPALIKKSQISSTQKVVQMPAKPDKSPSSINKNYRIQTYLLALLNVLILIIIALLCFNLLQKKSKADAEPLNEVLNSLKTSNKNMAAIDTLIKRELKKLEQS